MSSHSMMLNQGGLRRTYGSTPHSWRGGGYVRYSRFERRQFFVSCHFDKGRHQYISDLRGQRHDPTLFIMLDELCCCCVVCVFRGAQTCGGHCGEDKRRYVWRGSRALFSVVGPVCPFSQRAVLVLTVEMWLQTAQYRTT